MKGIIFVPKQKKGNNGRLKEPTLPKKIKRHLLHKFLPLSFQAEIHDPHGRQMKWKNKRISMQVKA